MIAYKLMRIRRDGSLGPLFINRKQRIEIGVWLKAESYPTKGFAVRPGWHGTLKPVAPHLKKKRDRVWAKCKFNDYVLYDRPKSQGGKWILAKNMKVLEIWRN